PGIFEIDDDSSLRSQIETSGGLSTTADGTRVIVERIENRTAREVEEFKLDAKGMDRKLQDGDIIHVFPISPRVDEAVTLRGNVLSPGRYVWHSGMRIS